MPISFNQIPINLMTPGVYVEFDNSKAIRGLPGMPSKALIIGQRLSTGTVAKLVPTKVTSVNQAIEYFGRGSMLHQMVAAFKANNSTTELECVALDDLGAGVAATGQLSVVGPATATGTQYLYIAGRRIAVGITVGDAATAIATAIAAAINAEGDLPVTAAVNGTDAFKVDIAARHKGLVGNDIDIRLNYYSGEKTPSGVAITITAMANGDGNPDVADVITAVGDAWYNTVVMPYTDAANLVVLETELAGRWGPMRPIEGHAFAAAAGSFSTLSTLGDSRNSPHLTVMGTNGSPTPPVEVAAMLAGVAAYYGNIDPARPFQTLPLIGMLPPAVATRFTREERNLLLLDGISTFTVDAAGRCLVERLVTTYNLNAQGLLDTSYLDVNILLTLAYLRYSFRARFSQKFPRHKLADDGTKFGAGQAVMTPKIAKAECYALFRAWEEVGLVENFDQFKTDLVVERNVTDPNRLDILLPPDLMNQLRVTAAQIQYLV